MATITTYIMVSKFGDALQIELEPIFAGVEPILFQHWILPDLNSP